jgi:hypothetical protein
MKLLVMHRLGMERNVVNANIMPRVPCKWC